MLGSCITSWTTEEYKSENHSLKILNPTSNASKWGNWNQQIIDSIPTGKNSSLKVLIKTDNIAGNGVALMIRCDDSYDNFITGVSTEGSINITGTSDWKEYSLKLSDNTPANTAKLYIYLVLLSNTSGTVYFDDITYSYSE